MGTLFDQPVRKRHQIDSEELLYEIETIKYVAKKSRLDTDKVIDIYKVASINRFIDCYVSNGDVFDEQMAGFGEILNEIKNSLGNVTRSLEEAFPQNS